MSSLFHLESSLTVREDKLKVADCVWFHCPHVKKEKQHFFFFLSSVFFLVQPGKKYNWFFSFLHFVIYLVPVHSGSILSSVLPTSPLFFCPRFILILSVSPAPQCGPQKRQYSSDSSQTCYLKETEKQASEKRWLKETDDNVSKAGTAFFVQPVCVKEPPAAYVGERRRNTWRMKMGSECFTSKRWQDSVSKTTPKLTQHFVCATTERCSPL